MASPVTGPQQLRAGALKALVLVNIGSDGAAAVRWRQRTTLPTVELLDPLRVVFIRQQLPPAYVDRVFRSESGLVALEQCKGAWRPVLDSLVSSAPEDESLASLAAAFRSEVEPLSRVRDTRCKHETAWNAVVTWAVARDGADQLLPMSVDTLYALLWDALSVGGSLSVLKGLVNAVQARHKFFELTPPVSSPGGYTRLTKALSRFQGTQRRHVFPIHRDLVVRMLLYEPPDHAGGACPGPAGKCRECWKSLVAWRNALCCVGHTIGCMRPDEGHNTQLCDWWPEYDALASYAQFVGGAVLNVIQKNDARRHGAHKRFGKSQHPALDFVAQMREFQQFAGLQVHTQCKKRAHPAEHCPVCPPLWPRTLRGGISFDLHTSPTSQMVSSWIVEALGEAGVDTSMFSGVCARRGGLSTAIEAGVPEVITWMQSCHAQDVAARLYVELRSQAHYYSTWAAFKL